MDKNLEVFKISNYDKFKCTADKCSFTCCGGWDIDVDEATYKKWESEGDNFEYILKNVKLRRGKNLTGYYIKKRTHKACPLLDEKGLCQIVNNHGEQYLSVTCHSFPRIENNFKEIREFSLSCSCPEVVELINNLNTKIGMISKHNNKDFENFSVQLKLRQALVKLCQKDDYLLGNRFIKCLEMLANLSNTKDKDSLNYEKYYFLLEQTEKFKNIDFYDYIEKVNNLFMDITINYRNISGYRVYLNNIYDFAESIDLSNLMTKWYGYRKKLEKYSLLIENCVVSKIFNMCKSSHLEDIINEFQLIIIEFILITYALFLNYLMEGKVDNGAVKAYITVFSRIIGNNSEAVKEYFSDYEDDSILYMSTFC